MTPKQLISMAAVTCGIVWLVLVCIDWSPIAAQDPARTFGLNAQGVLRWGENPNRAPFSVFELSLHLAVGLVIFDTYVYRNGIMNGQFSYSAAVGIFKSVVGTFMVVTANKLSKVFGDEGIY